MSRRTDFDMVGRQTRRSEDEATSADELEEPQENEQDREREERKDLTPESDKKRGRLALARHDHATLCYS